MRRDIFVSDKLNEKIRKPFIFISWKHDPYVKVLIEKLVAYLESRGINVVWDEGNLAPNERLEKFQQLIISNRCYKVLVISTKNYLDSIEDTTTGVGKEYDYISDHYSENPKKYYAITVNNDRSYVCSLLSSALSADISNHSEIAEGCALGQNDNLADPKYNELVDVCEKINIAIDEHKYEQAFKLTTEAKELISDLEISKSTKCQILNSRILCYLSGASMFENINDEVNELYKSASSSNYLSKSTQAVCLLNCSKVFQKLGNNECYLDAAEKASNRAEKNALRDSYDYHTNYAIALYENDRMIEATRLMKLSYESFLDAFKDKEPSDEDICTWIKLNETFIRNNRC